MHFALIKSLFNRAAKIDHEIEREQRRKWPDRWRLVRLKKIRLMIKDRIMRVVHRTPIGMRKYVPQKI